MCKQHLQIVVSWLGTDDTIKSTQEMIPFIKKRLLFPAAVRLVAEYCYFVFYMGVKLGMSNEVKNVE